MKPRIFLSKAWPGEWVCQDCRGYGNGYTPAGAFRAWLDTIFNVGRMTITEYQARSKQLANKAAR